MHRTRRTTSQFPLKTVTWIPQVEFLKDTYISLVKLTAYLTETYNLGREQIIRHHDVTGKDCPIYYTEHEDYWEDFRDDVMTYRELCKKQVVTDEELETILKGTGTYLSG